MAVELNNLVAALRDELQQYGEMLARLDEQQDHVLRRASEDLIHNVDAVQAHAAVMENARRHREATQREVAVAHGLPAKAAFADLLGKLPADYRGLVSALVQENNELLVRVQQRLRQNHLLLARSLELMQNFLATLIPPVGPATYSHAGNMSPRASLSHPLLEALG